VVSHLDQLLERTSDIDRALYLTLRDLFSMRVDMMFYALCDQVKHSLAFLSHFSTFERRYDAHIGGTQATGSLTFAKAS
jgi:hypothetical protein